MLVSPRYCEWNGSIENDTSAMAPVVPSVRVNAPMALTVLPAMVSFVCAVEPRLSEAMPACARVSSSPGSATLLELASLSNQ